jgi:hypothetical protein
MAHSSTDPRLQRRPILPQRRQARQDLNAMQPPRVSEFLGLNAPALSPSPFAASSESKCWREHRTQVPPASLAKSQRWTFAAGFQRSLIQPRFLTWVGTALLRVPDLRCRPGSTGSLLLVFASFAGFCGFPEVHRRKQRGSRLKRTLERSRSNAERRSKVKSGIGGASDFGVGSSMFSVRRSFLSANHESRESRFALRTSRLPPRRQLSIMWMRPDCL